jgi:hypothetical protein
LPSIFAGRWSCGCVPLFLHFFQKGRLLEK